MIFLPLALVHIYIYIYICHLKVLAVQIELVQMGVDLLKLVW